MCDESVLLKLPGWAPKPSAKVLAEGVEFALKDGTPHLVIDACIAPALELLWANGFKTIGCCCGHGAGPGVISLDLGTGPYQGQREHHCTKCGLLHARP